MAVILLALVLLWRDRVRHCLVHARQCLDGRTTAACRCSCWWANSGSAGLLIFGMRFLQSFLPELLGLAGVVRHRRASPAHAAPALTRLQHAGPANRTEARTAFLEAWIDHAHRRSRRRGDGGRFAGRLLDGLRTARTDAAALASARADARFGAGYWKPISIGGWAGMAPGRRRGPAPRPPGAMTPRRGASPCWGLAEGADRRGNPSRPSPADPAGTSRCRRQRRSGGPDQPRQRKCLLGI